MVRRISSGGRVPRVTAVTRQIGHPRVPGTLTAGQRLTGDHSQLFYSSVCLQFPDGVLLLNPRYALCESHAISHLDSAGFAVLAVPDNFH